MRKETRRSRLLLGTIWIMGIERRRGGGEKVWEKTSTVVVGWKGKMGRIVGSNCGSGLRYRVLGEALLDLWLYGAVCWRVRWWQSEVDVWELLETSLGRVEPHRNEDKADYHGLEEWSAQSLETGLANSDG